MSYILWSLHQNIFSKVGLLLLKIHVLHKIINVLLAIFIIYFLYLSDSPARDKTHSHHLSSSGTTDTEAIIRLDLEIISEHSPSNSNGCDMQIANLLFSNLDIVG
jgi:hypothetical protein